jgi:hypothetical protein
MAVLDSLAVIAAEAVAAQSERIKGRKSFMAAGFSLSSWLIPNLRSS